MSDLEKPDSKIWIFTVPKILKNIEGIGTVRFNEKDVVRHRLVQDIIRAYQKQDEERQRK